MEQYFWQLSQAAGRFYLFLSGKEKNKAKKKKKNSSKEETQRYKPPISKNIKLKNMQKATDWKRL